MLQTISDEDRLRLTEQFTGMCEWDRCHRCFDIVLDFIVQKSPLKMVRECYGTLREYLAWGYPFTLYRLRNHSLQSAYAEVIQSAADRLVRQD